MKEGRLFQFDEVDAALMLMPYAVRRLLDIIGTKLSLEAWRSLELRDRQALLRLGSAAVIDAPTAREILARAVPQPLAVDTAGDPPADLVPEGLSELLGVSRPIPVATWISLEPLERWVLDKVARGRHPERLTRAYDEIVGARSSTLTHLNEKGEAHMVGIAQKSVSLRRARAVSQVTLSPAAHRALVDGNTPKGDVLGTARIAGIMAAKQTSQLIPLCHPIQVTRVTVNVIPSSTEPRVDIEAEVEASDRTGVEMEAMVAVSIAALAVYDMLKAIDRAMVIGPTRLISKTGGKSGDFSA